MDTIYNSDGTWFQNYQGKNIIAKTDDYTVTEKESGAEFTISVDGKSFTLPAISSLDFAKNAEYTFRNIGASTAVGFTVKVASTDNVIGTIGSVNLNTTAGKGVTHTKATTVIGDWIKLKANGSTAWYVEGGVGVYAAES